MHDIEERQTELNNFLLNQWKDNGCNIDEINELQLETICSLIDIEIITKAKPKEFNFILKHAAVNLYLKHEIEFYLYFDEEGENLETFNKWVELYNHYWKS